MYSPTKLPTLLLAVGLLGACAGSPVPSAPSAQAPGPSAAAVPVPVPSATATTVGGSPVRSVNVLKDPSAGEKDTIAKYWNYGRDYPFQINAYTATGIAQASAADTNEVKISALVQLPDLAAAKAFTVLQEDEAGTEDDAPAGDPQDGTPADDDAAAPPSDGEPGATAADEGPDDAPVDDVEDVDGGAEDTTGDEGAVVADDPPAEDLVVEDAGDVDWEADSVGDYLEWDPESQSPELVGEDPELPGPADVAKVLSTPHEIEVSVEDDAAAGSSGETATYKDLATGQAFVFTLNPAGDTLTIANDVGTVTFAAAGKDVTLDGQTFASAKARLSALRSSPVMQATSPFALSMLAARLARRAAPAAERSLNLFASFQATKTSTMTCGRTGGDVVGYVKTTVKPEFKGFFPGLKPVPSAAPKGS